ncbi:MAG: hypothetical protein ACTHL3_06915 [Candidatus Nitrosocosmicus sp.]
MSTYAKDHYFLNLCFSSRAVLEKYFQSLMQVVQRNHIAIRESELKIYKPIKKFLFRKLYVSEFTIDYTKLKDSSE